MEDVGIEVQPLQRAHRHALAVGSGADIGPPRELAHWLLAADDDDAQLAGLYLAATIDDPAWQQSLYDDEATYPALARHHAAEDVAAASGLAVRSRIEHHELPPGLQVQVEAQLAAMPDDAKDNRATAESATGEHTAIIVHGTYAAGTTWWRPHVGQFWNFIRRQRRWPHLYAGSDPFWWSGLNRHSARVQGARDLVDWARRHGVSKLDVIAHSHGGNVCLEAAQRGLAINRLVLLGTPIRTEFMLALDRIASIRNVFSISDWVQIPGTLPHRRGEGRTLADSATVSNVRAADDGTGRGPGHSDLHSPATWQASGLDRVLT